MIFISGKANETGFKIEICGDDFDIIEHIETYDDEHYIFIPKLLKQWHGCEHKVINLLQSRRALTLENLSKTSRFSLRDGASYYCSLFVFIWLCGCIFVYFCPFNIILLGLLCVYLIIWKTCIKKIILWLFWPLAILIQTLTTDEPENWQMEQGLEVARKIKARYEIRKLLIR